MQPMSTGFMRIPAILKVIPIARSTWWKWVKDGRAPKGIRLSRGVTAWRVEDIQEMIKRIEEGLLSE